MPILNFVGSNFVADLFRRPVSQTAFMQHLQRLVASGHYFWCADTIPLDRLASFAEKWSALGLAADIPARAYRKQCGKASVHLCLPPLENPSDELTPWWMLSTIGKLGLAHAERLPGAVFDCRQTEGRLTFKHYELLNLSKTAGTEPAASSTWTWRLTPQRYREWEAMLIMQIKARDFNGLKKTEQCLLSMPMFGGIRSQVKRLFAERNKFASKMKLTLPPTPSLPVMRMVKLWA